MLKLSAYVLTATLAAATASQAATYRLGAMEIGQPWSRPAAAGTNAIGYMTLANRGKAPDALVSAASPLAAKVEIHSSSMAGGVMKMAKVDRVAIPAGGSATFGPGAYHLMLLNITKPLKAGDVVPATLTFASGAKIKVEFNVGTGVGAPAAGPGMAGMDMSH